MKRLALGLVPLVVSCSQPERRADAVSDGAGPVATSPAPTETAPPTPAPTSMAPTGAPDAGGIEAAAPPPGDDKKRVMEEYKALALKNDCSKGYKDLSGTWKFVGETKTPNYKDTLTIEGSKFRESISGNPDGKPLAASLAGEIRCVFKNRVLVQIDRVEPDGAYGNKAGDSYPCDLLHDMDDKVDRMLMICFFDWDLRSAAGLEFEYERVVPTP